MFKFSTLAIVFLLIRAAGCTSPAPIKPIPPRIPLATQTVPRDATNAGRVESIAVDPTNRNHAIIAMEFGGLWKTYGGGSAWFRITSLQAVFVRDVEFSEDGKTVVAAVFRDNQTVNGGGIYVSRDGGETWKRPPSGVVPATSRTPARTSAHSVSYATGERGVWYVGTDYGVAVSRDHGGTWVHRSPEEFTLASTGAATPLEGDRQQDAAQSVLGMSTGKVLAMSRTLVFRSDDYGVSWRKVITDNFRQGAPGGGLPGTGGNKMDRSPYEPWAFIYKEYKAEGGKLWFYELDSEIKTLLPFPQGRWRGPFVRITKDRTVPRNRITIWVGAGWDGYFVKAESAAAVRNIAQNNWGSFIAPAGIHADMGDLGVDGDFQPAYLGSDGGIFKPHPTEPGRWISAAPPGSGMNSFQIMDFAGTNINGPRGVQTHLYFGTQDNKIWASPDGGNTWPHNDSQEGYGLEVRGDAVPTDPITVGYRAIGAHAEEMRFSDALLVNSRPVPNINSNGQALTNWGLPFFLTQQTTAPKPSFWARMRRPPDTPTEVFVSPNSGTNWTQTGILNFAPAGEIKRTANGVIGWVPVQTGGPGNRIGLVPLIPTLGLNDNTIVTYDDSDLIRLPNNGSLGLRATMWDFHAVFGVHPVDWGFLIAPDIINNDVKVTLDGGQTWRTDVGLTKQVLRGGQLKLYDNSPYFMQVTSIAFDPYLHGSFVHRIFVGTRDAGIMCSADNGGTWRTIKLSDEIKYITSFHFHPSGGVYVSAYGHGLWYINPAKGCPEAYKFPWDITPPVADPRPALAVERKDTPRPRGEASPNVMKLFLTGSLPTSGVPALGDDNALSISGHRFPPNSEVTLSIRDSNALFETVRTDDKGRFTTKVKLPEDMPFGVHTLDVSVKGDQRSAMTADFIKAYADSK